MSGKWKVAALLFNNGGTNIATVDSTSVATAYTLHLPSSSATGALYNDGTGALSWNTNYITISGSPAANELLKFSNSSTITGSGLSSAVSGRLTASQTGSGSTVILAQFLNAATATGSTATVQFQGGTGSAVQSGYMTYAVGSTNNLSWTLAPTVAPSAISSMALGLTAYYNGSGGARTATFTYTTASAGGGTLTLSPNDMLVLAGVISGGTLSTLSMQNTSQTSGSNLAIILGAGYAGGTTTDLLIFSSSGASVSTLTLQSSAFVMNSNFTQNGTGTFATGTGTVSLNGITTISRTSNGATVTELTLTNLGTTAGTGVQLSMLGSAGSGVTTGFISWANTTMTLSAAGGAGSIVLQGAFGLSSTLTDASSVSGSTYTALSLQNTAQVNSSSVAISFSAGYTTGTTVDTLTFSTTGASSSTLTLGSSVFVAGNSLMATRALAGGRFQGLIITNTDTTATNRTSIEMISTYTAGSQLQGSIIFNPTAATARSWLLTGLTTLVSQTIVLGFVASDASSILRTGTITYSTTSAGTSGLFTLSASDGIAMSSNATFTTGAGQSTFNGNIVQTGSGSFTTGISPATFNGNIIQTGTGSVTTGTGAIALNGTTTITSKDFNMVEPNGGLTRTFTFTSGTAGQFLNSIVQQVWSITTSSGAFLTCTNKFALNGTTSQYLVDWSTNGDGFSWNATQYFFVNSASPFTAIAVNNSGSSNTLAISFTTTNIARTSSLTYTSLTGTTGQYAPSAGDSLVLTQVAASTGGSVQVSGSFATVMIGAAYTNNNHTASTIGTPITYGGAMQEQFTFGIGAASRTWNNTYTEVGNIGSSGGETVSTFLVDYSLNTNAAGFSMGLGFNGTSGGAGNPVQNMQLLFRPGLDATPTNGNSVGAAAMLPIFRDAGVVSTNLILGNVNYPWGTIWLKVAAQVASDRAIKDEIEDCDLSTDFLRQLKPRRYHMKDSGDEKFYTTGFIAQELDDALAAVNDPYRHNRNIALAPERSGGSLWTTSPTDIIAITVKSLQDAWNKIDSLEARLAAMASA